MTLLDGKSGRRGLRATDTVLRAGVPGIGGEVHVARDEQAEGDPLLAIGQALGELAAS